MSIWKDEKGSLFPIAIILLFLVTSISLHFVGTYQSQLKLYNSLEFANVRATITILTQIGE